MPPTCFVSNFNPKDGTYLLLIFISGIFILNACSPVIESHQSTLSAESKVIQIINPAGPAVIPLAGILNEEVKGVVQFDIHYWKTTDDAIGYLSSKKASFAVLPITTAVNISASDIDLVLLGVHEWKVFYLLAAEGVAFTSWKSLIGKTVYSPEGRGQTVDILTRFAIQQEGLDPEKDVSFTYAPPQEIASLFMEGKIEYAALPEPFVSQALSTGKGKIVVDYQDYWSSVSGAKNGIPIAGLFVTRDYLDHHPSEINDVINLFSTSVKWSSENTDMSIKASSNILPYPEAIMQQALKRIKFEFVSAKNAKAETLHFLKTIKKYYPAGLKVIPDDRFFFQ